MFEQFGIINYQKLFFKLPELIRPPASKPENPRLWNINNCWLVEGNSAKENIKEHQTAVLPNKEN